MHNEAWNENNERWKILDQNSFWKQEQENQSSSQIDGKFNSDQKHIA